MDCNKKEEIVRLLQNGADINEQNSDGRTALNNASFAHHTEIVQILLKNKNINVNLQNIGGWSPFYRACLDDSYGSALLMIQDPRVDINMAENNGWSPLMRACYWGRTKIVQLLLSFGRKIDIHKKSTRDLLTIKSGSTALDVAKQRNKTDVVQLLEYYRNNPKETQKLWRNELSLKGKK